MKEISSVYIHIPFCKKICKYCDFAKYYYDAKLASSYFEALEKEVRSRYQGEKIKTIYIGGGTPSSLSLELLEKLFAIVAIFDKTFDYEFTFECNVNDITEDLLKYLKAHGVNRLSIGIESFNLKVLATLGRDYLSKGRLELACKYFTNISCDLIYGVNGESLADLKKDLEELLIFNFAHLSIYSLILEEHTLLALENYQEISSDLDRDMYDLICATLKEAGYEHYEISNFAKPGFSSCHNLVYWNNEFYYGFGASSASYEKGRRFSNQRGLANYIADPLKRSYEEEVDQKRAMEYEMILGLRKLEGVSKKRFYQKYQKKIEDVFNVSKLEQNKDYYFIKESDLFISNSILCDFILD